MYSFFPYYQKHTKMYAYVSQSIGLISATERGQLVTYINITVTLHCNVVVTTINPI